MREVRYFPLSFCIHLCTISVAPSGDVAPYCISHGAPSKTSAGNRKLGSRFKHCFKKSRNSGENGAFNSGTSASSMVCAISIQLAC